MGLLEKAGVLERQGELAGDLLDEQALLVAPGSPRVVVQDLKQQIGLGILQGGRDTRGCRIKPCRAERDIYTSTLGRGRVGQAGAGMGGAFSAR